MSGVVFVYAINSLLIALFCLQNSTFAQSKTCDPGGAQEGEARSVNLEHLSVRRFKPSVLSISMQNVRTLRSKMSELLALIGMQGDQENGILYFTEAIVS